MRPVVRGGGASAVSGTVLAVLTACAPALHAPRQGKPRTQLAPETEKVWRALIEGRAKNAEEVVASHGGRGQGSSEVLFAAAEAGWAFARADEGTSVKAALEVARLASSSSSPAFRGLDALAVTWLGTWLDEGVSRAEGRLDLEKAIASLKTSSFSWEARFLRADTLQRAAKRRLDTEALAAEARALGCVTSFARGPALGALPHLDLDGGPTTTATPASLPGAPFTTLPHSGCDVDVLSVDGRPAAEQLWAQVQLPESALWRLVLDTPTEARVRIDGREVLRHNGPERVPSRLASVPLSLSAGPHEVEVRLANVVGRTRLAFALMKETHSALDDLAQATEDANELARAGGLWAEAVLALRLGDPVRADAAATELEVLPAFFLGQAAIADVRRTDPTRPAALGRDAARQNLRRAWEKDPGLQRVAEAAAALEVEDDHAREAIALLKEVQGTAARPTWWAIELARAQALRGRGLSEEADRALAAAVAHGRGSCAVWEAAVRRAQERRERAREDEMLGQLVSLCPASSARLQRLADQGRVSDRVALLSRMVATFPGREDALSDLAEAFVALGQPARAIAVLETLIKQAPLEPSYRLRLIDAWSAAGDRPKAQKLLLAALDEHPESAELLRAARTLGVKLPLDAFRLDGKALIKAHQSSGKSWDAPAVMILDRAVTRVFPNGAQMTLTHNIVKVQTKDGIDKWGEVSVPDGAEILTVRTHKADGSIREAESIAGKDSLSAPDLAAGDFVEWETLETEGPASAFRGGFIGDRFYFRSYDAPLERSEALIVAAPERLTALEVDRRAGAPAPVREAPPAGAGDVAVLVMRATNVPQLFAERSAVPAIEYVPSARVASGVSWIAWCRFVKEELYANARQSPLVQQMAAEIRRAAAGPGKKADPSARQLAEAVVAWTSQNVEGTDELQDSASEAIARGRGSRLAVVSALAAALGLKTDVLLVRSRLVAGPEAPTPVVELDDFAEPLLRFRGLGNEQGADELFVDVRLKHAPFGYLPPALDGARFLALEHATFGVARGRGDDHRQVDLSLKLESQGGGRAIAQETLRGWPALEWAELVDRFGADRSRLRQDFEQRWLGAQFPGAVLEDLDVEVLGADGAPVVTSSRQSPLAYAAAGVKIKYSFSSPALGTRRAQELTLLPTFFRSQPGRRFATEARRSTALQLGFDVPLDLRATVELPTASHVVDLDGQSPERVGQGTGYRFDESRELLSSATRPTVLLRRDARVPLMRVSPEAYPSVAADLRRVDAIEQRPLRIKLASPERERTRPDAVP